MLLELSNDESRVLKDAVDSALNTLLDEIAHADQREHKEALRQRYDRLAALQRRLEPVVESEQVYA
ncbi:hypothetical protein HJC10_09400 [Corallococcus exiguus]|uniref:hypothetical protein n=1 Tax=Corallococcus TaxID=83461 RepID=UPI000ECF1AB2|nr:MULTISPECIES: hypothetical protein [Corallococcus]NNB84781.1 hypothetical protein [Corallococcus exiguus]NNB95512.1 hypothetical protein [Corallococcus exiguus]NNC03061.1 hypothetical protein [Corallococcus exiguus]NPC45796.1 hypothetical protein [Corallococcus exiguus]RKH85348.1 hypothetical protein D7X99_06450 [Corallococcus sp. AB032C]